ncbi:calmodulin-alpha-like [Teleopsis dalmanni]|uniref:calmodulin-alpha-like n=1 Tax=Teleopsis dalmanni TaxID=139649 RepID=UPI0018CF005D|nr:calmodulin-alpha-like [Teleopsis dalmanni]
MADQLTVEEIEEIREGFNLFDKNEDGNIPITNLGLVMRSLGRNPTESELRDMITEIDIDKRGVVEFDDFLIMMERYMHNVSTENEIREAFRVFDPDGNGFLTVADLKDIMTTMGEQLSEEEVEEMIKDADVNNEGHINYNDYVTKMFQYQ